MLFIGGEWSPSSTGAVFDSTDPATGEVLGQAADGTREDMVRAIASAKEAFPAWAAKTAYERAAILMKANQLMLAKRDELATLMTKEQGKPIRMARTEVTYAADFLSWFAEEAKRVYGQTIPSSRADHRFMVLQQPVGVAAAITPWNYPISMLTRKIGPALAAGCTIVVKPAEQTPLCAIATIKILEEAGVPAGVVNLVTTSDPINVGEEILTNPTVRKISFTGSTEVGKELIRRSADHVKRMSMELGGHAPLIVFPDADVAQVAQAAVIGKFRNNGQVCISPSRFFIHEKIAKEFTEIAVEIARNLKMGNGLDAGTQVGPMFEAKAIAKAQELVDDARAHGASILTGGCRSSKFDKGFYYEPTVLENVDKSMRILNEEPFAPVMPLLSFGSLEEVIAAANNTPYGLAAYVFTNDLTTATRMAEGLEAGIIGINDPVPATPQCPFGGMKESGLGRELGVEGLESYLETKYVSIGLRG